MSEVKKSTVRLSNGKYLKFVPLDATKLLLDTSSVAFIKAEKNEDSEIISVSIEDKYTIYKGDKYEIKVGEVTSIYEIHTILVHKDKSSVILLTDVPTKTSTFLIPLLGKTKKQLNFTSYYKNTYLTEDKTQLALVYRFTGTELYKRFEQYMITDPLCVTHKDYDSYHVTYFFAIPKEFSEDVKHFVDGKYSKFSKQLRQRITKFYGNDASLITRVIKQDVEYKSQLEQRLGIELPKDSELASKPDLSNEIYELKYVEKE